MSDVVLKSLNETDRLLAFRYHDLILLKNYSDQVVSVRGRPLARGGFCRIYPGQRILVGDQVLTYQELATYFNAKKNVSMPQIFIRVNKDSDEVELERSRSRESALEVTFGLKVQVRALRNVDAVLNGVQLKAGKVVEATLEDKIVFHNDSEMDLIDLRRRARAMGGRFQLKASKSEYLVSNNPSLLRIRRHSAFARERAAMFCSRFFAITTNASAHSKSSRPIVRSWSATHRCARLRR